MPKNTLYEMLEVSENASDEVIEKAYKVLAKKYHPDLQKEQNKKSAEIKMKEINEAYEVLGNKEKRREYDLKLQMEREEERIRNQQENTIEDSSNQVIDNDNPNDIEKDRAIYQRKLYQEEMQQRKKMQENLNKEYENAYYNYLRSLGYRVKHKWTKENVKDFFIVIGIMILIFMALWFIPPTHDWLVNFYEQNPILKAIVDLIIAVVTGIFKGIWKFITGLFIV